MIERNPQSILHKVENTLINNQAKKICSLERQLENEKEKHVIILKLHQTVDEALAYSLETASDYSLVHLTFNADYDVASQYYELLTLGAPEERQSVWESKVYKHNIPSQIESITIFYPSILSNSLWTTKTISQVPTSIDHKTHFGLVGKLP